MLAEYHAPLILALPSSRHCHGPHPSLPSFPTRRSSDLLSRETSRWRGWRGSERTRTWNFLTVAAARCTKAICSQSSSETVTRRRSEEHTSELQSPDHLVCRLLLEKKKKKYIYKL